MRAGLSGRPANVPATAIGGRKPTMEEPRTLLNFAAAVLAFAFMPLSPGKAQRVPTWELIVCAAQDNLPYSNSQEQGFENEIITLISQDLDATLTYVWLPKIEVASQNQILLEEGRCDLFLDVGDNSDDFLTTIPYFQTTYYFVYREDAAFDISSFDDEALTSLRIGVITASPPDEALGIRNLAKNVRHYYPGPASAEEQQIKDVVSGKLDVAVIFGPSAGKLALERPDLKVVPVAPEVDLSGLLMVYQTAMGLRLADTDLRDLLNNSLARTWDEIQSVLESYNIPVLPLPKPIISVGG